jgi:hypothetical protein
MTADPHETGFRVAAMEISQQSTSFAQAKERGLYEGDQDSRIAWDQGYEDCVCAFRLGHDVWEMVEAGLYEPSLYQTAYVVGTLLDGTWTNTLREDPRAKSAARTGDEFFDWDPLVRNR